MVRKQKHSLHTSAQRHMSAVCRARQLFGCRCVVVDAFDCGRYIAVQIFRTSVLYAFLILKGISSTRICKGEALARRIWCATSWCYAHLLMTAIILWITPRGRLSVCAALFNCSYILVLYQGGNVSDGANMRLVACSWLYIIYFPSE